MNTGAAASTAEAAAPGQPRRRAGAALLVPLLVPLSAAAGDWQLTPRLRLAETYTDNVRLDAVDTR
ncbi:MAG: hypothetical protein HKO62_07415, partial [Gammaproteobacteria bacterium]|nr:hypothetical protein [Gammaproteobacteria bacterium]